MGGGQGDLVVHVRGGTFEGGDGPDQAHNVMAGTFDGGPDEDEILDCLRAPGVALSVEIIATDRCPPA
jgi:hypothetical protein